MHYRDTGAVNLEEPIYLSNKLVAGYLLVNIW